MNNQEKKYTENDIIDAMRLAYNQAFENAEIALSGQSYPLTLEIIIENFLKKSSS